MQRLTSRNLGNRRQLQLTAMPFLLFAVGCFGTAAQPGPASNTKPLAGTTLKVSCPDDRLRALIEPMVRVWAHGNGATASVTADPMNGTTDVAILPTAELGARADRGELAPVPFKLREPGNGYQWTSVLPQFRADAYAGWGGQLYALPVAAETSVIVYRADLFADPAVQADHQKKFNRPLSAPATWEAFADTSAFLAERDKKPSLPALDAVRIDDLFFRVAACFDRPALTGEESDSHASLGFVFDLANGRPRLETKGFVEAAKWLATLKSRGCLPAGDNPDPAAALNEGRAVLAVVTLADLMKLNPEHKRTGRYGLAALPGTRSFVNPATGALATGNTNRVPYLGGGQVGVVRQGTKHEDAAFALLAELTGPVRSLEIAAAGGYAPVREQQLEPDRLLVWLGYGFDDARTRALQDSVRTNLGATVRNPVYGLRTPDEAELRKGLGEDLAAIANGTLAPEAGLKRANEKWGRTIHLDWHRRAAGLN